MIQNLGKYFVDQVEIPIPSTWNGGIHAEANVADMRFGSTEILSGKVLFERQKFRRLD